MNIHLHNRSDFFPHQRAGAGAEQCEIELLRTSSKHFKPIQRELTAKKASTAKFSKDSNPSARKAFIRFKAAGLAILAARSVLGVKKFREHLKKILCRRSFLNCPEFAALRLLQACFRRVQPLPYHPCLGEISMKPVRYHQLLEANRSLQCLVKAATRPKIHFVRRFWLVEQFQFLSPLLKEEEKEQGGEKGHFSQAASRKLLEVILTSSVILSVTSFLQMYRMHLPEYLHHLQQLAFMFRRSVCRARYCDVNLAALKIVSCTKSGDL
eukprot:553675-Hanusia_phi.AAC.3